MRFSRRRALLRLAKMTCGFLMGIEQSKNTTLEMEIHSIRIFCEILCVCVCERAYAVWLAMDRPLSWQRVFFATHTSKNRQKKILCSYCVILCLLSTRA